MLWMNWQAALALLLESSPCSLQLEKSPCSNKLWWSEHNSVNILKAIGLNALDELFMWVTSQSICLRKKMVKGVVCSISFSRKIKKDGVFPDGASCKEPVGQCRRHKRHGFDPWVGKIPWRRAWQPTPVFLPGESPWQRSLAGHSPWGHKESDMTEAP